MEYSLKLNKKVGRARNDPNYTAGVDGRDLEPEVLSIFLYW